MSFRLKLVALLLFVALVPLLVSAVSSLRVHQQAFDGKVDELQRRAGEQGAAVATLRLEEVQRSLGLLLRDTIRWPSLSPEERSGALWLAYRHHDDVVVTALLDERGTGVGASAYLDGVASDSPHLPASPSLLEAFARAVPFDEARRTGVAIGAPIDGGAGAAPLLPLAFAVAGPASEKWVVAVLLSLRAVCTDLASARGDELGVLLVDGRGRVLCPAQGQPALRALDPGLSPQLVERTARLTTYRSATGVELRAAIAPLRAPLAAWTVVAEQPAAVALAAGRTIRARSIYWIALSAAIALLAGTFLAGTVSRPVRALADGADEISRGNFAFRLATPTVRDEIGQLAEAFNQMCREIEKRDAEIRGWNEELQRRIDQRTAELRETQAQLVQSQKIAAVASLGAGFAHEVNNPLTSVLGYVQVLLRDARERKTEDAALLEVIEGEAQRIRTTVETVLKLSGSYVGDGAEGFVDVKPRQMLDEALRPFEQRLVEAKIELVRDYAGDLPDLLGDGPQLQDAVTRLIENSIAAMRDGGRLTVSAALANQQLLRIEIADTGVGIPEDKQSKIFDPFYTTKEEWRGVGLGLTVVYRTVERHLGQIKVASAEGVGTTITLTFPAVQRQTHLV